MATMDVTYIGLLGGYRALTEDDLAQHGIRDVQRTAAPTPFERSMIARDAPTLDVDKDLIWGPHNDNRMRLDVTPDLELLLRRERQFTLVAVNDSGDGSEVVAEGDDTEGVGDMVEVNLPDQPKQHGTVKKIRPDATD
jgi:hypothetical protein